MNSMFIFLLTINMQGSNHSVSLYIEDVKTYMRIVEHDFIDKIASSKLNETHRYISCDDTDYEDWCSQYMPYDVYTKLEDHWCTNKSKTYILLETILDNLKTCTDTLYYNEITDGVKLCFRMDRLVDRFKDISTLLIKPSNTEENHVRIYSERFLLFKDMYSDELKPLLFISNILAWYSKEENIKFYSELTIEDGCDKFATIWNDIMRTSPYMMENPFRNYYHRVVGDGYSYYYYLNIINNKWYISLSKSFDPCVTIVAGEMSSIVVENGFIVIADKGEYFISVNNLDINEEYRWFDHDPQINGKFALVNSNNDYKYIASTIESIFKVPRDKETNEKVNIKCIKDDYSYNGHDYILLESTDGKLYMSVDTNPSDLLHIVRYPNTNEEAHELYNHSMLA